MFTPAWLTGAEDIGTAEEGVGLLASSAVVSSCSTVEEL